MFEKGFQNKEVNVNGQSVGLGASKLIKVPVDRLPTGTIIEIPVYVFNGKEAGPTILLQGGLHGDEINSIELVRRMLIDKRYKIHKGCVIVVPLLNVFGFLNLSRDMHGKDVNRCFPGSKTGSLASRIAKFLMRELIINVDFAIDFHTGGAQRNNFPQIRFTAQDTVAYELAKVFNAPIMFASKLIPKSFRNECFKNGIPVLVYEGGESLRIDEHAIEEGIHGTLRILKSFQMIDATIHIPEQKECVFIKKRRWIRAKEAGLLTSKVANGSYVKKGEVIGNIMDTYGETNIKIKSPIHGYILSKNNFPIINMGDAIFHVGEL